jgi:hypothetical protein
MRALTLRQVEAQLGIAILERHRHVMLDPADPIHESCDFLGSLLVAHFHEYSDSV